MDVTKIKLKPKKESFIAKIKNLFEDKKKRYLYMILFMLPFLIVIGIFGYITYREAKSLLELATGEVQVVEEYNVPSMNYILRGNATDVQKEYFMELKHAIEVDNASDETIAGLICKNYVADHYTWANKQGQYDVGGLYYVFDMEETKTNTYLQARDGFYKYLNKYINEYGADNLLEVENVQVTKSSKLPEPYFCYVHTHGYTDELGHFYYEADHEFEAWEVTCTWTYKASEKIDTSKYATSMNFIVVLNGANGRYEIVEASEKDIVLDAKPVEEQVEDQTEEQVEEKPTE